MPKELNDIVDELNREIEEQIKIYSKQRDNEINKYNNQIKQIVKRSSKENDLEDKIEDLQAARDVVETSYNRKINALKDTQGDIGLLWRAHENYGRDLDTTIIGLKQCMERLEESTEDLPATNPLKQLINKIINKVIPNITDYFKTRAHDISQKGKAMLTGFEKRVEKEKNVETERMDKDPKDTNKNRPG